LIGLALLSVGGHGFGIVIWPGVTKTDVALALLLVIAGAASIPVGLTAIATRLTVVFLAGILTARALAQFQTSGQARALELVLFACFALAVVELGLVWAARIDPAWLRSPTLRRPTLSVVGPVDRYDEAAARFLATGTGRAVAVVLGALAVSSLTWDSRLAMQEHGLDNSWITGLYMGTERSLELGRQLVVVGYGPFGFLSFPVLIYPGLSLLAYVFVAVVHVVTVALLIWACYRIVRSRVLALVIAGLGMTLLVEPSLWQLSYIAPVSSLIFVWCGLVFDLPERHVLSRSLAYGGGILAAVELLSKLTIGILVLALVAYTIAAARPRRLRELATFFFLFIAGVPVFWLLSGQALSVLPDYLRDSREVVTGYSQATGGPIAGHTLAAALIALGIVVAGVFASARPTRRHLLALLGLVALFMYQSYRVSLIIGGSHLDIYFGAAVTVWFALSWHNVRRPVAGVALVALILVFSWGTSTPIASLFDYGGSIAHRLESLPTNVSAATTPSARRAALASAKAELRQKYALSPRIQADIGSAPVHIEPVEATVAWAYGFTWRPVPVFQALAAYTTRLDMQNASAYASPARGPRFVLRAPVPTSKSDDIGRFRAGGALISLICHFRNVTTSATWELTVRVHDRCGTPQLIRSVRLRYGDTVDVPRQPHNLVFLRLSGVQDGLLGRVVAMIYRSPARYVTVNGISHRYAPAGGGEGLLLSVPEDADYPAPFALSLNARTVSVSDEQNSHRTITAAFYAVPIS